MSKTEEIASHLACVFTYGCRIKRWVAQEPTAIGLTIVRP